MKKPRLTAKVLRGLSALCHSYEAGAHGDTFGNREEHDRENASDVQRACEWATEMATWREHS